MSRDPLDEQLLENMSDSGLLESPLFQPVDSEFPYRLELLAAEKIEEVRALELLYAKNPWSWELLLKQLLGETSFSLGLVCEGELVAQSFSYIVLDELHILNIGVHPCYRGQRLGKYLLASVISFGLEKLCRFASLEVRESNLLARQMYKSFSFKQINIRYNYYRDNGENALVLERGLFKSDLADLTGLRRGIEFSHLVL